MPVKYRTPLAGLTLALLAFAAQRQTPSSPAVGGLYALPILLSPWTTWQRYPLAAALLSIALATLGSVGFGAGTLAAFGSYEKTRPPGFKSRSASRRVLTLSSLAVR